MGLVSTIVDLLTWRVRVAETGVELRLRSLMSFLVIVGGVGAAIGFALVDRLQRPRPDPGVATPRRPG